MKKLLSFILVAFAPYCMSISQAQESLKIQHGPYLQELTENGSTFVFQSSKPSYSYIELREKGDSITREYYQSNHGLKQANTDFFAVRANDLKPASDYQYRVVSKEMVSFKPYKVIFGDSIVSKWHDFKTIDPRKKGGSFFITSDTHSDTEKLNKMLENNDYKSCDAFFYLGDMMNYMSQGGEHPFSSFIDLSVNKFASSIPFEVVRGNHETRGDMARVYPSFFPKSNNKIYGSYLIGDIMVVMLDSGEDKSDAHPVYAGITDYDAYRSEQVKWLEELVQSKEYKKAKYRIVLTHFPLVLEQKTLEEGQWKGWYDAANKFLPIINKANVDLVVSGHTHQFEFYDKNVQNNNFVQLVQGAVCSTRLDMKDGKINVQVLDLEGKPLLDQEI